MTKGFLSLFRDTSVQRRLQYTAGAGLLLTAGVIICLYFWNQSEWMNFPGPFTHDWEGYTFADFVAIFCFTALAPVAFCLLFTVTQFYIRIAATGKSIYEYFAAVAISASILLGYCVFGFMWGWNILQCGVLLCVNTADHIIKPYDPPQPEAGLGFKSTIGMSYLLASVLLLIALAANAIGHYAHRRFHHGGASTGSDEALLASYVSTDATASPMKPYTAENTSMRPSSTSSRRSEWHVFILVALALIFLFCTTTYIPNSWEYFTPSRIAAKTDEEAVHVREECGDWPHKSCPEYDWAVLKTINIALTDHINAKLYPGNVTFYVLLITFPLFALLSRQSSALNTFFSKKIRVRNSIFSYLSTLCSGAATASRTAFFSVREIASLLYMTGMCYLFFHYWYVEHNFNGYWPPQDPDASWIHVSERLARAIGQVAVFFFSLLLFPAARNSPLLSLIGVSWEAAIQYHRWLGVLFMVFTVGHVVCIYWWYWVNDLFPEDLWSIPMHLPTSIDNFTVPLIQFFTWLSLITIGYMAIYEPFRRKNFDVFLFAHHFTYMVMIPAVLWHAAAAWEYMLPGLIVWFTDRCVRAYRSTQAVHLVHNNPNNTNNTSTTATTAAAGSLNATAAALASETDIFSPEATFPAARASGPAVAAVSRGAAGDFIELRVRNTGLRYQPGHYVFINIAEVSLFEWHPFTIASPVHTMAPAEVVFYIKTMGAGTWTQSLFSLVEAAQTRGEQPHLTVSLDGPYGMPVTFTDYDAVLLVGGGVGVTPCKSIFESLYLSYLHDCGDVKHTGTSSVNGDIANADVGAPGFGSAPVSPLQRVQLFFSARDPSLFDIMQPCLQHLPLGPFTASLFCDNPADPTLATEQIRAHPLQSLITQGRPALAREMDAAVRDVVGKDGGEAKVLVFVCGPEGLANACEEIAYQRGWAYHTETFAL